MRQRTLRCNGEGKCPSFHKLPPGTPGQRSDVTAYKVFEIRLEPNQPTYWHGYGIGDSDSRSTCAPVWTATK